MPRPARKSGGTRSRRSTSMYFSSNAPMVIGDHILVGTGNDMDTPAFLKSLDPRTGAVQWILYSTPQNPGDPGLETWASLDAARHGNGATWIPGSYDPETHLYMYGTGNPTPAYTQGRGDGDNLFTSSLHRGERRHRQDGVVLPDVAARHARLGFHADAGARRRHVQRPHAQAGDDGDAQRLLLRARSHDRRALRHAASSASSTTGRCGLDEKGQPKRNPNKDATIAGSLVNGDVTELSAADVLARHGAVLRRRTELAADQLPDGARSARVDGARRHERRRQPVARHATSSRSTTRPARSRGARKINGGSSGLLSTAGGVLFVSNGQNVEAWDAATGKGLWYSQIGGLQQSARDVHARRQAAHAVQCGTGLYMFVSELASLPGARLIPGLAPANPARPPDHERLTLVACGDRAARIIVAPTTSWRILPFYGTTNSFACGHGVHRGRDDRDGLCAGRARAGTAAGSGTGRPGACRSRRARSWRRSRHRPCAGASGRLHAIHASARRTRCHCARQDALRSQLLELSRVGSPRRQGHEPAAVRRTRSVTSRANSSPPAWLSTTRRSICAQADAVAIAGYIHSVQATSGGQGSPPGRNPTERHTQRPRGRRHGRSVGVPDAVLFVPLGDRRPQGHRHQIPRSARPAERMGGRNGGAFAGGGGGGRGGVAGATL